MGENVSSRRDKLSFNGRQKIVSASSIEEIVKVHFETDG